MGLWPGFQGQAWIISSEQTSNPAPQLSASVLSVITMAPLDTYFPVGEDCSSQYSQLGKTIDSFYPLPAGFSFWHYMKANQQEKKRGAHLQLWFLNILQSKCEVPQYRDIVI